MRNGFCCCAVRDMGAQPLQLVLEARGDGNSFSSKGKKSVEEGSWRGRVQGCILLPPAVADHRNSG